MKNIDLLPDKEDKPDVSLRKGSRADKKLSEFEQRVGEIPGGIKRLAESETDKLESGEPAEGEADSEQEIEDNKTD